MFFGDVHVRVKRVILKHHGDVALFRLQLADRFVVEVNFAPRQRFKARQNPQSR